DPSAPIKGPSTGNLKGTSTQQDIYDAWTSDTRAGGAQGRVSEEMVEAEQEEKRRRRQRKREKEQRRKKMLWSAGLGGMAVPLVVFLLFTFFSRAGKPTAEAGADD